MNQEYVTLYTSFLRTHMVLGRPLTVVADASNGTAGLVLRELGDIPNLKLILINDVPHGDFPAHGPNPLHPGATDQAGQAVVAHRADLGVIFDADGDRAFFVDEKGHQIPAFIIATMLFKQNKPPFVAEELIYMCLKHMGLTETMEIHPSRVGTFYVKEVLNKIKGTIGAEYSGHYYYKDFFNTDSGIFTMIQVINMISKLPGTISEFYATLPNHKTANEDIRLEKIVWADIEKKVRDHFSGASAEFATREGLTVDLGDAWINIRPSNTEPLLRLFAGSKSDAKSAALVAETKSLM